MTTFAYTTGNPANLTGGATASMNDIQGPFTDLRTFLNGANLDAGNLAAAAKPATLLGQFAGTPLQGNASTQAGVGAGTYWLGSGVRKVSGVADSIVVPLVNFGVGGYAVSGLTAMARVTASVLVNDVAPACNFTFGLHGVTSAGGGPGALSITSGGLFGGNTATISNPPANSSGSTQAASADFAVPTSGIYGLAVVTSAVIATNSFVILNAALQIHWV